MGYTLLHLHITAADVPGFTASQTLACSDRSLNYLNQVAFNFFL